MIDNKMADKVVSGECSFYILMENKGDKGVYNCKSCREYELQLKETLEELNLAQVINKLLQKELVTYTTMKNACGNDLYSSNNNGEPLIISEWTIVTAKNHKDTPKNSGICETMTNGQLIKTSNCYTLLTNLSDNHEDIISSWECRKWPTSTKNIHKNNKQSSTARRNCPT